MYRVNFFSSLDGECLWFKQKVNEEKVIDIDINLSMRPVVSILKKRIVVF